jgi:hypothetical protein
MAIIDKPSDYFNTKLYTGTGSELAVTGVGFQPDWIWFKQRDAIRSHALVDSVRGRSKVVFSDLTNPEETSAASTNDLVSFDSDGFTVGTTSVSGSFNTSSGSHVAWNWKANGAGSANTTGSINSTVSVNTTSGFSIVKWSGTSATGTIGHGLGSVPKTVWVKSLANAEGMYTYWQPLGNDKQLLMSSTSAQGTTTLWNSTTPTSSVFSVINHSAVNGSGDYIAYCFAEKQGYSKIGSYTGNGSADGPFVYTGFKPAFVLQKSTAVQGWQLQDNKREGYNGDNDLLQPHDSAAESGVNRIDILSNGFKVITTDAGQNSSGQTYIYMAFAENPFVSSTGVPATAR